MSPFMEEKNHVKVVLENNSYSRQNDAIKLQLVLQKNTNLVVLLQKDVCPLFFKQVTFKCFPMFLWSLNSSLNTNIGTQNVGKCIFSKLL